MFEWVDDRATKLRDFFELEPETELISPATIESFQITDLVSRHLENFNIEWHIIPSAEVVPIDTDDYKKRLYPSYRTEMSRQEYQQTGSYKAVTEGHKRHQGRIIGIETTQKPIYLPDNKQFYGTHYGFDSKSDPFKDYLGMASLTSGTRFSHTYASLRAFVNFITEDWRERGLMPAGYRLTICPPVIFNLIGNVFHPEWSATPSLELGFYRDEHGNAKCYAVGSNAPDDFSYISEIETSADWTLLGFRTALVPE